MSTHESSPTRTTSNEQAQRVAQGAAPTLSVIVVGAGNLGRAIGRLLGARWEVQFVDRDPDIAKRIADDDPGGPAWSVLVGDGTSRLVLERAGAGAARALVAATGDDEANLECCRVAAQAFRLQRVLAIVHDRARAAEFTRAGAEPIVASSALATLVANRFDRSVQMAERIGLGQGEIVEVGVGPTSPARGRPLRSFQPRDWVVAAVYRRDTLIVPHGDTVIHAGDRLLLAGQPAVLPAVAEFLRGDIPPFPLPYGPHIVAIAGPVEHKGYRAELDYLASSTVASDLVVIRDGDAAADDAARTRRPRSPASEDHTALDRALAGPGLGCLVVPPDSSGWAETLGLRTTRTWHAINRARCPVLVARGTYPYRRILMPVTLQRRTLPMVRLAVGLAQFLGATLTAVTVTPPEFVAGRAAIEELGQALGDAIAIAEAERLAIETVQLAGNPIHEILGIAGNYDLVVLAHRPDTPRWRLALRPDVSAQLAQRCARSTLVLPIWPEAERVG